MTLTIIVYRDDGMEYFPRNVVIDDVSDRRKTSIQNRRLESRAFNSRAVFSCWGREVDNQSIVDDVDVENCRSRDNREIR